MKKSFLELKKGNKLYLGIEFISREILINGGYSIEVWCLAIRKAANKTYPGMI